MKSSIKIPEEILISIDFANTIHGGMSEITPNVKRSEEGYEMTVKAPGLRADQFEVDVANGRLFVYQLIPIFDQFSENPLVDLKRNTRVLSNFYLPNDADFEQISARYDATARLLRVFMPFNNDLKDLRKHIDVES